jgi:hypothetical protein
MKRLILTAAAASTMLFAVATVNSSALAAPIAPSAALPDAARSLDQVQDVRYYHHHYYRRHWGWHRPYYRHWGWRHRYWHRHW